MKKTLILTGEVARQAMHRAVDELAIGQAATFGDATRTNEQNAALWPRLEEISQQVEWYGQKLTKEEWKDVFSAALKKQKVVPGLDGGFVVCGQSTSKMGKREFSDLLELINAFAAERGVVLGDERWAA
jgi:hypothetical protein